jgi:hypothetical protein
MSKKLWIICLEECLPEFGININKENIELLANVLEENARCISDMSFEMSGGRAPLSAIDYKTLYENSKKELDHACEENNVFRNSVSKRRNVPMNNVYISNGAVLFDK